MPNFCNSHRLPRAHVDPIDDVGALLLVDAMIAAPLIHETIVVLLDHERRGLSIINVTDTADPDAVLDIADVVVALASHQPELGGIVVASVRPDGTDDLDDVERWLELDDRLSLAGVELVEWYVIGHAVSRPRVLVGEPTRWAA